MADDQNQRPFRSNEPPARAPASAANSASDPLAELARLIGQADPFAEFGRNNARSAAPPQPAPPKAEWPAAPEAPPPAPNFGANNYFGAAPAPAAQPPAPDAHRPYADPSYAAAPDPYHAESEAAGYPAAQTGGYEAGAYPQQPHQDADDEEYYDDVPPPRRRMGIMAIAAVFALAVIGTAGAFGYRAIFGNSGGSHPPPVIKADTTPSKVVPASANKAPNKLIYDRVADHAQDEKLVSREEQPIEMKSPAMAMVPTQEPAPPAAAPLAAIGSGVISSEPKKVRTIAIHPDQMGMTAPQQAVPAPAAAAPAASPSPRVVAAAPARAAAPPPPPRVASNTPIELNPDAAPAPRQSEARAAPPVQRAAAPVVGSAPLSLSPDAGDTTAAAAPARAAIRTASVPAQTAAPRAAHAASGGYAVQVSSQRSEAEAQASFRSLQAKYPNQLGGRQAMIHKVELGAKGTYYRALVGPFASANEASTLCSDLKAAGGQCLIQRN